MLPPRPRHGVRVLRVNLYIRSTPQLSIQNSLRSHTLCDGIFMPSSGVFHAIRLSLERLKFCQLAYTCSLRVRPSYSDAYRDQIPASLRLPIVSNAVHRLDQLVHTRHRGLANHQYHRPPVRDLQHTAPQSTELTHVRCLQLYLQHVDDCLLSGTLINDARAVYTRFRCARSTGVRLQLNYVRAVAHLGLRSVHSSKHIGMQNLLNLTRHWAIGCWAVKTSGTEWATVWLGVGARSLR